MGVRDCIRSYCDETPIHGFGFIPKSFSPKFKCFWLIVILAAVGCSFVDFVNLVEFYRSIPTQIGIKVHRRVDLVTPPVPVLCLEINQFFLPPPELHRDDNSTLDALVAKVVLATQSLTTTGYRYYDGVNNYMPYDILYYTYAMLGYMSSVQLLLSGHPYDQYYYDLYDIMQDKWEYTEAIKPYIEIVFHSYKRHNVSFEKLTRLVGSIICYNYIYYNDISPTRTPQTTMFLINVCSTEFITHLSFGLVCMRMGNESMWATANFDMVIPGISPGQFWGISEASAKDTYGLLQWHIDFQGRPVYGLTDSNNIYSFQPPMPSFDAGPITINYNDVTGNVVEDAALHSVKEKYNSIRSISGPSAALYRYNREFFIGHAQHHKFFKLQYLMTLGIPATMQQSLYVQLHSYIKAFNKPQRPCYTAKQMFNAQLEQRAAHVSKKCGCWPSQLYLGSNNHKDLEPCEKYMETVAPLPNTALKHFIRSNAYVTAMLRADWASMTQVNWVDKYSLFSYCDNQTKSIDEKEIVQECDIVDYKITQAAVKQIPSGTVDKTSESFIRIQVRNVVYSAIVEASYKTWSTFVSEFGGSIGVWLGGSLIAFLHIPLFIGSQLIKRMRKPKLDNQINAAEPYDTSNPTLY